LEITVLCYFPHCKILQVSFSRRIIGDLAHVSSGWKTC